MRPTGRSEASLPARRWPSADRIATPRHPERTRGYSILLGAVRGPSDASPSRQEVLTTPETGFLLNTCRDEGAHRWAGIRRGERAGRGLRALGAQARVADGRSPSLRCADGAGGRGVAGTRAACAAANWVLWGIFAAEYALMLVPHGTGGSTSTHPRSRVGGASPCHAGPACLGPFALWTGARRRRSRRGAARAHGPPRHGLQAGVTAARHRDPLTLVGAHFAQAAEAARTPFKLRRRSLWPW